MGSASVVRGSVCHVRAFMLSLQQATTLARCAFACGCMDPALRSAGTALSTCPRDHGDTQRALVSTRPLSSSSKDHASPASDMRFSYHNRTWHGDVQARSA